MPSVDYASQLHAQVWTLLEASTAWATEFKVGNRIKYTADAPNVASKQRRDPASLPEITIIPKGGIDSVFSKTGDQTLAEENADFDFAASDFIDERTEVLEITIRSPDLNFVQASSRERLTMNALRAGGPKLGLTYVLKWGPCQIVRNNVDREDKQKRWVSTIAIPVVMQFHASEIQTL